MDAAFARLSVLNCSIGNIKRQDGSPFDVSDFLPYTSDGAVETDDDDPTPDETIAGFMAVLGAKKNG